jgi:hypothetical protein
MKERNRPTQFSYFGTAGFDITTIAVISPQSALYALSLSSEGKGVGSGSDNKPGVKGLVASRSMHDAARFPFQTAVLNRP